MRPFWIEQALFNDGDLAPALQGEHSADVCIVGGGFTGLWTAIQRGRGTSEVVPMLAGAVAAGARLTLGWPFDLRRLVTSSV